jgi:hypothetical protein
MKKLALSSLAFLVVTASAFTVRSRHVSRPAESALTTSAAYRDGLFVGRFAAESGSRRTVSTGRWVTQEDRDSYAAGYEQAYSASRAADNPK